LQQNFNLVITDRIMLSLSAASDSVDCVSVADTHTTFWHYFVG